MGGKFCVTYCNGNYNFLDKVRVFRLSNEKDPQKREHWFSIIPRKNIPATATTVVCEQHQSESFQTLIYYGKERPKVSPSLFDFVKPSMMLTRTPAK